MPHLHDEKLKFLEEKANQVRISIIEELVEAGSGNRFSPGPSFNGPGGVSIGGTNATGANTGGNSGSGFDTGGTSER